MQLFFLKLNPELRGHCVFARCNFFLKTESETLFNLSNAAKNERNFFLKTESETAAEICQYRFLLDR